MKPRALIPLLLAAPAIAQYSVGLPNQHGHRVGHQFAHLVESGAPLLLPPDVTGVNPRVLPELESTGVALGIQANTQLTNRGIFNIQGGPRIKLTSPVPSVEFETWTEDVLADSGYADHIAMGSSGLGRMRGQTTIQRFVRDDARRIYVSYSATVEMLPEPGVYRVSFADSSPASQASPGWDYVSPPVYPAPQILHDGETVALVLYLKPRKLVDYIRVGALDKMDERKEAPHESYADDSQFTLAQPRVKLNGIEQAPGAVTDLLAPVLWVYIPEHGRYVFSFLPHPDLGFDGVAEANGNFLTFADGVDVIRIESAERIGAGSGVYRVHFLKDATWTPAGSQDRATVMIGSAPGLESPAEP